MKKEKEILDRLERLEKRIDEFQECLEKRRQKPSNDLLNKRELAFEIGRSPAYVSAMVREGYSMPFGGRSTRKHALEWLEKNPLFRASDIYFKPSKKVLKRGAKS